MRCLYIELAFQDTFVIELLLKHTGQRGRGRSEYIIFYRQTTVKRHILAKQREAHYRQYSQRFSKELTRLLSWVLMKTRSSRVSTTFVVPPLPPPELSPILPLRLDRRSKEKQ